jgi:P-type Cu+ transporter
VGVALLDKTGTLTEGRLSVAEILPVDGTSVAAVLAAAAAVEGAATHPIAAAIREAASRAGLAVAEATPRHVVPGGGVVAGSAQSGAPQFLVGSRKLLADYEIPVTGEFEETARKAADRGESLAFVAQRGAGGDRVLGLIGLADLPRADAARAVRRLGNLRIEVALLSGDHRAAVAQAAARAGIVEYAAEVSPADKVDAVGARRVAGAKGSRTVLLAGDGVNDAAALAAADVGVAFARGADVAIHAADVIVHAPHLGALADAVEVARATLGRIRENLALALLYNVVAVPLAATGFLHPLSAAIAMGLSSLAVTANSLRLLGWHSRTSDLGGEQA